MRHAVGFLGIAAVQCFVLRHIVPGAKRRSLLDRTWLTPRKSKNGPSIRLFDRLAGDAEDTFIWPDVESRNRNGKDDASGQSAQRMEDEKLPEPCSTSLSDFHAKKQQHWLDLRGTSLYPHEALNFIQDQCIKQRFESVEQQRTALINIVDAILVSPHMLEKLVGQTLRDSPSGTEHPYTLLYVAKDTKTLVANTLDHSVPIGKSVVCDPNKAIDLNITASIETVVDEQKWLLVDALEPSRTSSSSSTPHASALWLQKQVSSLLQLASSSSTALTPDDFAEASSGLFLPGPNKPVDGEISPTGSKAQEQNATSGGIAVSCVDRNMFMSLKAVFAEHQASANMMATLQGVLVPDPSDSSALFATALVLPLELNIWEAALDMHLME